MVFMVVLLMVQDAFLINELARIVCKGLERSDYKKIGCKLRDLLRKSNFLRENRRFLALMVFGFR
ncbi:hypothetical protein NE237_031960 [Protea cynaroides]|uniref:Uncharacterized protein n=1 Tax=Protea cynaroides TaxID=273540 RepID=A0A9Q0L276_9MAGN|nr:hypothetical protein NE237_031960 [Protea cynaroides]